MNITRKNKLTESDFSDIYSLIQACHDFDAVEPLMFTDDEINAIHEYKCFNMMYENNILISFLSVFIPGDGSAEIYICTSPAHRKKGCFSKMLETVFIELTDIGIAKVLLVCSPESATAAAIISDKALKILHSEFLLSLKNNYRAEIINKKNIPTEENVTLEIFQIFQDQICDDNSGIISLQFEIYINSIFIGGCLVESEDECAVIHDFYVENQFRGKGYGKIVLIHILDYLTDDFSKKIILQLHGDNIKAKNLYLNHGFEINSQVDYVLLKKVW